MAFNDTYRESIQTKHVANVGFTSTAKGVTNEANALKNPHQVIASQIPAVDVVGTYGPLVANGIGAGLVKEYSLHTLTADPTVNNNQAWYAEDGGQRVTQWMRYAETQYKLRLFDNDGVTEILPSEANFNWEYDASAGVIYFDDDPSSHGYTLPLKGTFYTYIGDSVEDGLGASTSGIGDLVDLFEDTNEPTGFVNNTDSTLSFDDGTRTLTISGTSFDYYIEGTKYTKEGAESIQIGTAEGLHYVFYNGSTLSTSNTWSYEYIYNKAYVAAVYWDATNSLHLYMGDERHGITMDGQTHAYLHAAFGTQFVSGFGVTGTEADSDGSSDNHANFAIATGIIRDEDLSHTLSEKVKTGTLPTFYRTGNDGDWRIDDTTAYPLLLNAGARPYWNELSGATWQKTIVSSNGGFVLGHVFATNDAAKPFIAIAGQAEYSNVTDAREGANDEINNLILEGLPFTEFIPVATFIYECNDTYTNNVKARMVTTDSGDDFVDWRFSGLTPNPNSVGHHGNLTGRDDANQHPAGSIYTDTASFGPVLDTADTTVQSALESLEDGIVSTSGTLNSKIDTEIATLSGTLADQIDAQDEFLELTDTIGSYSEGRILFESDSAVIDTSELTYTVGTSTLTTVNLEAGGDVSIDGNAAISGTLGFDSGTTINEFVTAIDAASTDDQVGTAAGVYSLVNTTSGVLQTEIDNLDSSLTDAIIWETVDTPFDQIRPKVAHQGKAIYTYGSMTIGGDLTVSGTTTTVHSEELTVADKVITVNAGETGAGLTGERYAGIEVDRGTEQNYYFVYDEVENNFRLGISGSLQAAATREDAPTDQYVAYWNASEYRFDTAGGIAVGDIASTANLAAVSGTLQSEIDAVASDLSNNYYTITQLDGGQLDNRYYTETELDGMFSTVNSTIATTSGALQSQIDTNASNISSNYSTLDTKIDTTSGTLQSQISSNDSDISALGTEISTASGVLQTQIDTNATNITNNYNTLDSKIDTTSGTLQQAIDDLGESQNEFLELIDVEVTSYTAGNMFYSTASGVADTDRMTFDPSANAISIGGNAETRLEITASGLGVVDEDEVRVFSIYESAAGEPIVEVGASGIASVKVDTENYRTTIESNGTVAVTVDENGFALETGADVNEISTTVNAASTDDQLATAAAVYTLTNTVSGVLQSGIDQNASDISSNYSTLDSKIDTVSGTLQSTIDSNYSTLDTKIDTTSGTLQTAIDALDTSLTDDIVWETVDTPFEQIRPKVAHQGKAIYTYGSMTIGGDLTVSGTTTTVHSEELTVADKVITVNAGETGAGITGERYAGIEVDRGTEENYFFVYDEVENNFRVGISGSLQAVATREDSPTDQYVAFWNASEYRFDTAGGIAVGDIASTADLSSVSGTLQSSIDSVSSDLANNYYTITELDSGQLDNRYYTETELDAMFAGLTAEFIELTDVEVGSYTAGNVLFTTASGVTDDDNFTFDSGTDTLSVTAMQLGTGGAFNELVTTVTSGTTNSQIPSAKAVWDLTEAAAAAVHMHADVDATYVSNTSWTYGTGFSAVPDSLEIFVNGVKQRIGASYDCTVAVPGGVLTVTFAYNVYSEDWVNLTYTYTS